MWKLIYRCLSYLFFIPGLIYLLVNRKTRGSIRERILSKHNPGWKNESVWIHAASVGEAIIAISVADFLIRRKELSLIFTTNTNYAKHFLERHIGEKGRVYYAPLDLGSIVRAFMRPHNFIGLILIETEIWPNMIWEAKAKRIPVLVINGRISDKSFPVYRRISFFMREVFSPIDFVLAQSETHAERFSILGVERERIDVIGNIKYFRNFSFESDVSQKINAVTFGSIRNKEKDGLIRTITKIKAKYPDLLFFLAPRELSTSAEMVRDLKEGFRVARYSTLKQKEVCSSDYDIILVDTVGDLPRIYAKSLIAFVGGSLAPYGGHNILEPLFFGTPVLFGPHVENFQDLSIDVMSVKAGFMVKDYEELEKMIEKLIADQDLRKSMAQSGRSLVQRKREEIENKLEVLLEFLEGRRK